MLKRIKAERARDLKESILHLSVGEIYSGGALEKTKKNLDSLSR